ncbi:non-canonical purine NTP pyrophosphatase, partial [Candidatus Falkowbacteria bacterium CG10_big_fil_rev_8_21_14_0_10_43_11]
MKLTFITTNKHKFTEVKAVLRNYGVEIEQVVM